MGKLVAIVAASEMAREYLIKQIILPEHIKRLRMASIALLIGGALANDLAFTGSSYLLSRLSEDGINANRKIHDAMTEQLQKAQIEWVHKLQERIDFINKQFRLE